LLLYKTTLWAGLLAVAASLLSVGSVRAADSPRKPNIVFILADDMDY
jgi:hypothetical protein